MALIEWNDDMSVGVDVLDDDHKVLMSFINELNDAVNNDKEHEVIEYILETLVDYTVIHFEREEKMFENTGYPNVEEHKELHKNLTDRVKDIQKQHIMGAISISEEVLAFLKGWLITHIQGTDKEYAPFLRDVEGE